MSIQIKAFKNRTQCDINMNELIDDDMFWINIKGLANEKDDLLVLNVDHYEHKYLDVAPCKGTMVISFDDKNYIHNYELPAVRKSIENNPVTNGMVMFSPLPAVVDYSKLPNRIWKQFGRSGVIFRILFILDTGLDNSIYCDDVTTEVYSYKIHKIVINK